MGFFIAMQNHRAMASYLHPQTILSEYSEFLIVKRSGDQNEYLSISNAGSSTGSEGEAPLVLHPELAIFATLVSKGPDESELFVVEKSLPDGQSVIGQHIGGDGCVFLRQTDDMISLGGVVRLKPGRPEDVLEHRCQLLAANEPGAAIHFEATHIPWSRELVPNGYRSGFSVNERS